jgi:glycosyltransferase involved in cell wall biosynthesis
MRYKITEIELSRPIEPLMLAEDESGAGIIVRLDGRLIGFKMVPLPPGTRLSTEATEQLLDNEFAQAVLRARVEAELAADDKASAAALPSVTIAICTKDRAERLSRLLASLAPLCAASPFASTEVLVIDNAPSDAATADAVAGFAGVRYVMEPKAGLNFARNAALENTKSDLLAFLDDDVVVDREWLTGLAAACRGAPEAGGFTGLVLPYKLDTDARVAFEARGGFGRGFDRREWHATSFIYELHPVGAGLLGAGCNMAFKTDLLRGIGGFDDALDTGAPLPGGGDLDIFYRVLRTGRPIIYEPRYAVYHEHRETIQQLRRQYWTWGLGMMAFLAKSMRSDPEILDRHRAMRRWWMVYQMREIGKALAKLQMRNLSFALAEYSGGIQGMIGEYERSERRIAAIRSQTR